MSKFISSFALCVTILFIASCSESPNKALIIGSWQGTEWLVSGKPSGNDVRNTSFTFNADGKYAYNNSGNKEEGTYKVENDMLFTTPKGEQEMMVKLAKLTKDSLVFSMNRGGQEEQLTLVKQQ